MNITDDKLHVIWAPGLKRWQAVGKEGSYGLATSRDEAIAIAKDASSTGFHGKRGIVIHAKGGRVRRTIPFVKQKPSPQFFQDTVE